MGGRITAIEKDRAGSRGLAVFVDGRMAFTVSEEIAARLDLAVGMELAEGFVPQIEAESDRAKARDAALRLLGVRARSRWELCDRLRRRGFDPVLVEGVVAALESVGLVDDREFAKLWADERVRLRPVGPRRLTQELLSKRVPREIVYELVRETYEEHRELDLARRALAKRARRPKSDQWKRERARMQTFLVRRGFSYETAAQVLRELEAETNE